MSYLLRSVHRGRDSFCWGKFPESREILLRGRRRDAEGGGWGDGGDTETRRHGDAEMGRGGEGETRRRRQEGDDEGAGRYQVRLCQRALTALKRSARDNRGEFMDAVAPILVPAPLPLRVPASPCPRVPAPPPLRVPVSPCPRVSPSARQREPASVRVNVSRGRCRSDRVWRRSVRGRWYCEDRAFP